MVWPLQKLGTNYEKAAKKLRDEGSSIKLAKVNAEAEKELAQTYAVDGFPTLMVMRHGRRSEYKGPRDAYGIIDHMKELAKPAAKKCADGGFYRLGSWRERRTLHCSIFC
ncbi:thioredoxin [Ostertagia ostertagi]